MSEQQGRPDRPRTGLIRRKSAPGRRTEGEKTAKSAGILKKAGTAALCLLMTGVIALSVAGCVVTAFVLDALHQDRQLVDLNLQKLKYTTIFYADDGETELTRAYDPEEGNRLWCNYDDMPERLIESVIAVEDKRFRSHNGVDFLTTAKAGLNAVLRKLGFTGFFGGTTPGASTITQQVVRNITGDRATQGREGYARKLREIFRALNLERHATKRQIMETYLNLAGFSQNCSGIRAAAHTFFRKDVKDLTVAECATIVGTTKNPSYYSPFAHFERNQQRKEHILGLMREQGFLTEEEYRDAMAQKIVLSEAENPNTMIQSWFMDYVISEVCGDLGEKYGLTEREAYQKLISGGYRIYTTCDVRVQEILQDFYSDTENFPPVLNREYPQSAFVITDTGGGIKGIVGSNRPKDGNRLWSRASDTMRQPGSTIKPISSYCLAMENDLITYSSVIEDRPVVINPDEINYTEPLWAPRNYYEGYKGFVTAQYALMRSINTIPVQLTQRVGTANLYGFLKDSLGLAGLVPNDNSYSPMALGSLTNGVTLVEMAGAYQMFSNGGTRTAPHSYTRVLDMDGNVALEANLVPIRVISEDTAMILNKMLQTVTGPYGTGAASAMNNGIPMAGKTGTTDDDVDQWFVGLTPYYVGVCWLGYDSRYQTDDDGNVLYRGGKPVPNTIHYNNYPPPILWRQVMTKVHEGMGGRDFPVSPDVVSRNYCAATGMLSEGFCETEKPGWYKKSNLPPVCSYHGSGFSSGIPVVGSTAEACGITYPDQYLTDAHSLQLWFEANARVPGDRLSVREAVEMAKNGIRSWDSLLASPYYERYAGRLRESACAPGYGDG